MLLFNLFDKLEVIKNELAMIDEQWSEWSFKQYLEGLEKWTLRYQCTPKSTILKILVIDIPSTSH